MGGSKLAGGVFLDCLACAQGKSSKKGISKIPVTHTTIKFFCMHIDLGIVDIKLIAGNLYFCIITNNYTCFCFVLFLKLKSEFYKKFVKFYTYVKTQYKHTIKIIRCDNGGEFTSINFKNFCATNGIVFEFTAPGTPKHNGVAKSLPLKIFKILSLKLIMWVKIPVMIKSSMYRGYRAMMAIILPSFSSIKTQGSA